MDYSIILLILLIIAVVWMFLFAIFSKPNKKEIKKYSTIINDSNNRDDGIPSSIMYEKLSEKEIHLNYLKENDEV